MGRKNCHFDCTHALFAPTAVEDLKFWMKKWGLFRGNYGIECALSLSQIDSEELMLLGLFIDLM